MLHSVYQQTLPLELLGNLYVEIFTGILFCRIMLALWNFRGLNFLKYVVCLFLRPVTETFLQLYLYLRTQYLSLLFHCVQLSCGGGVSCWGWSPFFERISRESTRPRTSLSSCSPMGPTCSSLCSSCSEWLVRQCSHRGSTRHSKLMEQDLKLQYYNYVCIDSQPLSYFI